MLGDTDLGRRIFALDRFVDMEELDKSYRIPATFDAKEYFSNYFGVIVGNEAVTDVVIRVEPSQAKYFRSLPIHHSQKESDPVDGWPVFTCRVAPTFDFRQEILSHGAAVEVLAPESLRKDIAAIAAVMNKTYTKE